jgi:hypothetical protein
MVPTCPVIDASGQYPFGVPIRVVVFVDEALVASQGSLLDFGPAKSCPGTEAIHEPVGSKLVDVTIPNRMRFSEIQAVEGINLHLVGTGQPGHP